MCSSATLPTSCSLDRPTARLAAKPGWFSATASGHSYRWVVLTITLVAQTTVAMLSQGLAPIAPLIQSDFSLTRAQVGILNLALGSGSYFSLALVGWLIDRFGERAMMLSSGVIAGSFAIAMLASRGYVTTLVLITLASVGITISTPAGSKAVMSWFSVAVRGTAMGIRQVGIPLGGVFAGLLLPAIGLHAGWRAAWALAGSLAIVAAAMCFSLYREPPSAPAFRLGSPKLINVVALLRNRNLWLIGLYGLAMLGAQFCLTLYLVLFATERLGMSVVTAGALLALAQATAVGSRIGWGVISDRSLHGERRRAMLIIGALAALSSVIFSFLKPVTPVWIVLLAVILFGSSAIGWNGLYMTAVVEQVSHASAGTALGITMTVSQLGVAITPPLFGLLVDKTGTYQPAWLALALLVLLGTLAMQRVSTPGMPESSRGSAF